MLNVQNLAASYGEKDVLKDLSFQVNSHEIIAIIGPSGSGKSTLLNCISGLHSPTYGKIELNEHKINPKTQQIAWIPQNYGLLPWKTVFENVVLGLKIKKQKLTKQKEVEIEQILIDLGIYGLKNKLPNQLSGGQRQRVAIARAFVVQSDLILMDEPFSALDALTRENTQKMFLKIWQEHKAPTILITHDVMEAAYLGSKILVLPNSPGPFIEKIANESFNTENPLDRSLEEIHLVSQKIRKVLDEKW